MLKQTCKYHSITLRLITMKEMTRTQRQKIIVDTYLDQGPIFIHLCIIEQAKCEVSNLHSLSGH